MIRAEERIYLEHKTAGQSRHIQPDLPIADSSRREPFAAGGRAAAVAEPIEITLPVPEEVRERFLTIRERETLQVITIIEVQSPTNKRAGSDGRAKYLAKRDEVLASLANLVELDLLRGGLRVPTVTQLPSADFYGIVSRGRRRPHATVYPWALRQRTPVIPIPLANGEPDVELDLQAAFTLSYDRAGYDYGLDYSLPIEPPLPDEDAAWLRDVMGSRARARDAGPEI